MSFTQDLFSSRRNYNDGNVRVGEEGRIWYESDSNTLRIGNGVPGGHHVSVGGDQGPVRSLTFVQSGPGTATTPGMITWNQEEDCLDIVQADGSTLQTGLEHYIRVYNNTANTIKNGTVVRYSGVYGSDGNGDPTILPHIADGSINAIFTVGILTNDIPPNSYGRATWLGKIRGINTTGSDVGETWGLGEILYVHPTMPGKMTKIKPTAPDIVVNVAAVAHVGATDGVILVRPTLLPRLYHGVFFDTTQQNALAINTPYAIKYGNTQISIGHRVSNNTRIVADISGLYNYQFSLQVASSSSSKKEVYIWARKNGVDIPASATRITVTGNNEYRAPAWNFVVSMDANDYFELMWATSDTNAYIAAPAATAFCPSIPSVILTVTQAAL